MVLRLLQRTAKNMAKSFTLRLAAKGVRMVTLVVLPLTLHSLGLLVLRADVFLAVGQLKKQLNAKIV